MTLQQFIEKYDTDNAIVLLEGKRNVLKEDEQKLIDLGKLLASLTSKMTFRSGNAGGADQFFSEGVALVNPQRLQVITPYSSHRKKTNLAYDSISLDEINLTEEPEIVYHSKRHKKTQNLVEKYVAGNRDQFAKKAAYIIRDTVKVLGTQQIKPASFGIFYDDLSKPMDGGTGHTMRVCIENNIPQINQTIWFNWLG
jgi:hypothetical protein